MFMECPASNYVGRDNTMKKIRERFFWPEYCKGTISRIMRLEYFYFTYLHICDLNFQYIDKYRGQSLTVYAMKAFHVYSIYK